MQTIAVRIEPLHPTRKEQKELSNAAALAQQGQNLKLPRLGRNRKSIKRSCRSGTLLCNKGESKQPNHPASRDPSNAAALPNYPD
jgi:hypothetical protein